MSRPIPTSLQPPNPGVPSREALERHVVHPSLVQTPLFAGVDFGILVAECALAFAVAFASGFSWTGILPALLLLLAVHLPLRSALRWDPDILAVFPQALRHPHYFAPHRPLDASTPRATPPPSERLW